MHWWPLRGSAVVIDATDRSHPDDAALAVLHRAVDEELRNGNVVVIASPAAAAALISRTSAPTEASEHSLFVMPTAASSLEDRIAAFAGSLRIISSDATVGAVAASYHRIWNDQPADHSATNASIDAFDVRFDEVVQRSGAMPVTATERHAERALRAINEELTAQLVHERVVFADIVRALRNQLGAVQAQQAKQHRGGALRRLAYRVRGVRRHLDGK
jgi:hypothetical protein